MIPQGHFLLLFIVVYDVLWHQLFSSNIYGVTYRTGSMPCLSWADATWLVSVAIVALAKACVCVSLLAANRTSRMVHSTHTPNSCLHEYKPLSGPRSLYVSRCIPTRGTVGQPPNRLISGHKRIIEAAS